jgi:light-regulated signal transduction histidine kinase (bacteriophytochrome)
LVFRYKTEQKKYEEEMKIIRKELEAFSHTISHDMRAPLRAIKGYATILEEDYAELLGKEGRSVLDIINKNALRMDGFIDDLLRFSKLGKEKIVLNEIDVRKEVSTILNDLRASSQRNADIILHDLPPILADQNMFVQVWTNLLSNAFKFTAKVEKPKIEIGCRTGETEVTYYVRDNGVGFDMKYADRLFGVFQRLHKASEFEGTGVGLSIVQRIISKHGGRVWAEGEINEGATFYFAMPKK